MPKLFCEWIIFNKQSSIKFQKILPFFIYAIYIYIYIYIYINSNHENDFKLCVFLLL